HAGERLPHLLAPRVALAATLRAGRGLEDAVVGHERHDEIDVVPVPAVAERLQILDRHHECVLLVRARWLCAAAESSDFSRLPFVWGWMTTATTCIACVARWPGGLGFRMPRSRSDRILVWMCVLIAVNQLGFGGIVPVLALYTRSFD